MSSSEATDSLVHSVSRALSAHDASLNWVLALSGGRDSMTLLHILSRLRPDGALEAVHVDHGLVENSESWALFCRQQCQALGVRFHSERLLPEGLTKGNLEANARRLRYQVLYRHIRPPALLMTAHHLGDQVETYLYRHFRGVGVHGAGAMAPISPTPVDKLILARPLLSIPSEAIERYARTHQLDWISDPQNQDLRRERNWLRHELHPMLVERFPALDSIIGANAQLFRQARDLCLDLASLDHLQAQRCDSPASPGYFDLAPHRPDAPKTPTSPQEHTAFTQSWPCWGVDTLGSLPARRLENLFHCFIRSRTGHSPRSGIIAELMQWFLARSADYSYVSVGQLNFRRWRRCVWVDDFCADELNLSPSFWDVSGDLDLPELNAHLPLSLFPDSAICKLRSNVAQISIRSRRAGEQIYLRKQHHKLKTLFHEANIAPWLRDRVPVLSLNDRPCALLFPQRLIFADELLNE